jgi:fatty acid desaturase
MLNFLKKIDRIWVTAIVVFVIAFWMAMISYVREYALFKSSAREYFLLQNEKTDYAIAVLQDWNLLRVFVIYSAFLIGLAPVILHRLVKRLWIGLLIVGILFLPLCWYGGQVTRVFGKFLDWNALFSDIEASRREESADSR